MRTLTLAVLVFFVTGAGIAQSAPVQKDKKSAQQKSGQKQTAGGKKPQAESLQGFDLNPPSGETAQITGGSRGGSTSASLLAPRKGLSYSTQPVFYWAEPKPTRTTFVLLDREHNAISRDVTKENTSFRLEKPLVEGTEYFWTIEPAALFSEPPAEAAVVVIGGTQRKAVAKDLAAITSSDPYAAGLARARVFAKHKIWYDAVASYTDLIAAYPDKAVLYRERAQIYAAVVATKSLAPADTAKAADLERAPKK